MAPVSARAARWLIVNADDLGISRGVNAGIVEAHHEGIVTAASLMPNLPAAEDALSRVADYPSLDLGLHLTLTAGRPLSPAESVPALVDGEGRFYPLNRLLARLSLGRVPRDQIRREVHAQLEWVLARESRPTHIDSHHHVHLHPAVADTVLALAQETGVAWVRRPVEGIEPALRAAGPPVNLPRAAAISLLAARLSRPFARRRLRCATVFRGIGLGFGYSRAALARTLFRLPPGLTELMTHPGRVDSELSDLDLLTTEREAELRALTSPKARAALSRWGVRLTTFREASDGGSYT
jgi:hopanoid biosynthesis associated protein HpnK